MAVELIDPVIGIVQEGQADGTCRAKAVGGPGHHLCRDVGMPVRIGSVQRHEIRCRRSDPHAGEDAEVMRELGHAEAGQQVGEIVVDHEQT
ncbi:hypothetical protein ACFQY5_35490 [Paeniroseomonas aquatica]|uniref:hypothetical protein n=1 Tax=Paeniroseomonas aquatica TaxID=373043 RepID=UPI003618ACB8